MGGGRRDGRALAPYERGMVDGRRGVRCGFFIEKRTLAIEVGAGKQKSRPDVGLEPDVWALDMPKFLRFFVTSNL